VFWSRRPKRSSDVRPARCKLREVILNSVLCSFGLAASALRAALRVRQIGIDALIDKEFLTRFSAMLTFTTGAKSRVGFHTFFSDGPYRGD
jgi:hypothetical protein